MTILQPGIYTALPDDVYHADPAPLPSLSRGVIRDLLYSSPLHAWTNHPRLNPQFQREDSRKFDLGSAAHDALLCGMERVQPVPAEDWRKKDTRLMRQSIISAGNLPVLAHQYDAIAAMVNAAREFWTKSPDLAGYDFAKGEPEVSAFWQERDCWCRCRFDWLAHDRKLIIDYKSTLGLASPEDWARQHVIADGLDLQAAWYTWGNDATGEGPWGNSCPFVFLVQEVQPPYACALVGLQKEFIEMGTEKCASAVSTWRDCLHSDVWPAYESRIHWISAPAYALTRWQERQLAEMPA
jgi:PDDEXK-like domain of unknown function (DUF3799)